MLTKFINPVLLLGRIQREMSGRLKNQAPERTPSVMPVVVNKSSVSEVTKTINGSVVTFEGTYQGKPIRVRIFNEYPSEVKP